MSTPTTAAAAASLAQAAQTRDQDAATLASLQQQVAAQAQTLSTDQTALAAAYQIFVDAMYQNEGLAPPTPTALAPGGSTPAPAVTTTSMAQAVPAGDRLTTATALKR